MINKEKWINSLASKSFNKDIGANEVNESKWTNSIPKENTFNTVGKYSITTILFVFGLIFVSIVKNETRNLEKSIYNLKLENSEIKYNLEQAILDFEVITSPENLSILAKEYLSNEFITYKKSQIFNLNHKDKDKNKNILKKQTKNLNEETRKLITKKIQIKKNEIKKLQALYSKPEAIPGEIKTRVVKTIEHKKSQIKNLYTSPKEVLDASKTKKWLGIQVVKAFLGMPFIPGK